MGLVVLDFLWIEVGLIFVDYEFIDQIDLFEVGIGFIVLLKSKFDDFIGCEVLQCCKDNLCWKLVGLDIDSCIFVYYGDCLYIGCVQVGEIILVMWLFLLDCQIVLVCVDVIYVIEGMEIEVGKLDGQQKCLFVCILVFLYYDLKKEWLWF